MKKLFTLTGIFAGIYLVFLFVLYTGSLIFPDSKGRLYDCMLESAIRAEDLSLLSKKYAITTFTTEYRSTDFFEKDVILSYCNNSDPAHIQYGLQKKLIRTNKILYKENSDGELKIQRFWAISKEKNNFHLFSQDLKEYGLKKEIFESHRMNLSFIFAEKNVEFFIYLLMLLFFCVSIYYILRSKEIAIWKLNGYKALFISMKILTKAAKRILTGYTVISLVFSLYLAFVWRALLGDFFRLYIYICLCLFTVLVLILAFASVFITTVSIAPALKDYRNNKVLMTAMAVFKVSVTLIFLFSAKKLGRDYLDYKLALGGYESAQKNFSYIKTSTAPDEDLMKKIVLAMESDHSEDIYNYSNPSHSLYGYEAFDGGKKKAMLANPPAIRMSHNMLSYIKIYAADDSLIDADSFDKEETVVLLPENLKNKVGEILKKYQDISKAKILYIKEKQEHFNFLRPDQKVYNALYILKPLEKSIYYNGGRVLFGKEAGAKMEKYLREEGVDKGTAELVNLESENKKIVDNMQL